MKKVNIFFVIVTGFLIVSFFGCNLISGGSGSLNKPVTEVITKKIGISDCQKIKNDSLLFSIPDNCGRVELINLWDEYDEGWFGQINLSPEKTEPSVIRKSDFVREAYLLTPQNVMESDFNRAAVTDSRNSPIDKTLDDCEIGEKWNFFIASGKNEDGAQKFQKDKAELKVINEKCNVWYMDYCYDRNTNFRDKQLAYYNKFRERNAPTVEELKKLGDVFDRIFEPETNLLGKTTITNDRSNVIKTPNKINILVTDLYDDACSNQVNGTIGYFYSADCYRNYNAKNGAGIHNSNETLMFYIDSYFLKNDPMEIYSTLAHEFCHMLNYINKVLNANQIGEEFSWFTELMAGMSEDVMNSYVLKALNDADCSLSEGGAKHAVYDARLPYFNAGHSYGFMDWDTTDNFELQCTYGNIFAFGAYLDRNYGGINLIHKLATNLGLGFNSIVSAVNDLGYSETEETIMKKFPLVIMCNSENSITLDRKIVGKIGGLEYTLDAIDLWSPDYSYEIGKSIYEGPFIYDEQKYCKILKPYGFFLKKLEYKQNNLNFTTEQNIERLLYFIGR